MVGFDIEASLKTGKNVSIPNVNNVVDAWEWEEGISFDKVIANFEKAQLPTEVKDLILEMLEAA
jgi:hypothetical protein